MDQARSGAARSALTWCPAAWMEGLFRIASATSAGRESTAAAAAGSVGTRAAETASLGTVVSASAPAPAHRAASRHADKFRDGKRFIASPLGFGSHGKRRDAARTAAAE